MPKSCKWYRVYRYEDNAPVGERAYYRYSAAQAVGYYVSQILGDRSKMADYYAVEVDGPNGWSHPSPTTVAQLAAPKPIPTPPSQMGLDFSGGEF